VRLLVIAALLLTVGGMAAWRYYKRRQAARELEAGVAGSAGPESDAAVLNDRMKDALATLRKARGTRGSYLYDIPWYILIGPPGSGKTTALVNSGLKFPLSRGQTPASIAGVGGTRYCDWWFTEDAVLIDTAGRYTTQDSDAKADRQSWLAFLDLLRKNRSRQPINGVLLAISLEDLLRLKPEELQAHADAVRTRLLELHDRLKVDFPVYALFTKADLVAGFREYFGDLREADRRMVWGATFQTDERTRNMIGDMPAEFDALVERLNDGLPDRLQEEPNHTARVLLFGFPTQMMALKQPLVQFLSSVFEPTRYHANAMLRGFYFTSGTQHGTPIDQLIGAMAESFNAGIVTETAYSGLGKSFFLTDLIKKVIIGEAGWVSTNKAATRRALVARAALYTLMALVAIGLVTLWSMSFVANQRLIGAVARSIADLKVKAAPILQQTTIADEDFGKVLQTVLHPLRTMPAGYVSQGAPVPREETFGLSQRRRLESAAESAYQRALERTFRSRLLYRLERQLRANINDPSYVYDALKVYLMLGQQTKEDDDLIVAWMHTDWQDRLYTGPININGRKALEDNLRAMLALDDEQRPLLALNGPLVVEAQKTLARMSVADRAYALLKSQAQTSGYQDFVAAEQGGPDFAAVFDADNGDLDQLRVPGFFTYDGFHQGFLAQLGGVAKRIEADQWVLGEAGKQQVVTSQYQTLPRDLLALYTRDFIASWDAMLKRLRLRPIASDKPTYGTLNAAAGEISPLRLLLQHLREQTELTKPPAAAPAVVQTTATQDPNAAPTVVSAEAQPPPPPDPTLNSGARFGLSPNESPGAPIEAHFRPFHALVEGPPGKQIIDGVIASLGAIRENLVIAAVSPTQAAQANAALPAEVTDLRTSAARMPSPFSDLMKKVASEVDAEVTGASVAQLSQAFNGQVTQACQQVIEGRYPFTPTSDRDVPLPDFARLFAPGALFDHFFSQNLASLVDTSQPQWTWRQDNAVTRSLSTATLRQFQRAAEIRDAFFPNGGNAPSISFTVMPTSVTGAESVVLKINATTIESQPTGNTPTTVEWPGPDPDNHSAVAFKASTFSDVSLIERRGPWAFYHLLDAATKQSRGDGFVATFTQKDKSASYEFAANSINNPLLLPALRDFRCPAGL
jgi:type VI secretion system protein ImpL